MKNDKERMDKAIQRYYNIKFEAYRYMVKGDKEGYNAFIDTAYFALGLVADPDFLDKHPLSKYTLYNLCIDAETNPDSLQQCFKTTMDRICVETEMSNKDLNQNLKK